MRSAGSVDASAMYPRNGSREETNKFEAMYRRDRDPWRFRTSSYERRRYAQTMASLSQARYRYAFEPGCSIGELTALLAPRCDRVLATDVSLTAARLAVLKCAEFPGVEIQCADLRQSIPLGPFDLTLMSELGYYFEKDALAIFAQRLAARLADGGELIAVHWLGDSADHALHGDEVHQVLLGALPMRWIGGRRFEGFRIDSWKKA